MWYWEKKCDWILKPVQLSEKINPQFEKTNLDK